MVLQRIDNERIILGIDPGTNIMGYGVIKVISNDENPGVSAI